MRQVKRHGAGTTTAGVAAEVRVTAREGKNENARITRQDWMTLPLDTLVEHKFFGMSLQQSELRCTSNTVHYVLNQEQAEDALLTYNELRRVLSKTPKFRPTPHIIKPKTVASDRHVLGFRIIMTLNHFVCKDFIERAKVHSKLARIVPKQFPHSKD
jgi:hypothetical protein